MKNTILFVLAILLMSVTVQAQSTADSIAAKYKLLPMPEPLTIEKKFPVLGTYQLGDGADAAETATIIVSLDPENKGIIWIEGLKEGKIKAYLKKSPTVYRIVPQKSASGKAIPEGTLVYDQGTGTLQVAIGKAYNEADPTAVFASASDATVKSKSSKSKVKIYTATRVVAEPTEVIDGSARIQ
jgi:hypothetical protein